MNPVGVVARCGGVLVAAAMLLWAAGSLCSARAEPDRITAGIYLTALNNLNLAAGTVVADFWLWTVVDHERRAPLETAYIVNDAGKTVEAALTDRENGRRWDQQRIRATLNNRFDVSSFPFDHQTVQIVIEDSGATADDLVYVADRERSGVAPDVSLTGWSITGWDIRTEAHPYPTNFGDLRHPGPIQSPRLILSVDVRRHGWALFLEQAVGAFIAFLIMALTFRMPPNQAAIFSGRMGVTAATVFTTLLSLRSNSGIIAAPFGTTLIDRIHLVTMAAGFFAGLSAVTAWGFAQTGRDRMALQFDRSLLSVFVTAYVVIVGTMTVSALAR